MADLADWVTLPEGKDALNITGTSFDTELAAYITAVSQRLDQLAGVAVIRTITGETHDVLDGYAGEVQLRYRPVATITAVTEYDGIVAQVLTAETNLAKTEHNYVFDPTYGHVARRASGYDACFPAGRGNVVVTYTAGRAATTALVAAKYKLAAGIYLAHLWRREQGVGSATFGAVTFDAIPTFGVPNVVRDLLVDDLLPPRIG